MLYIANAFSIAMLPPSTSQSVLVKFNSLSLQGARETLSTWKGDITSVVGHESTANSFSNLLNFPVPHNRVSVKLTEDDFLLVGQFSNARLPEGATELPDEAKFDWYLVTLVEPMTAVLR